MIEAKIRLSANEMELVMNAEWILTKNRVIEKAKWLLEKLQDQMTESLNDQPEALKPQVIYGSPKISKGENYQGLPYLVLDFPRVFQKENVLAIRTMFWWGNFFSTTLHLSGIYKKQAEQLILLNYDLLKEENFHACISANEWEHHFEISNYMPLTELSFAEFKKIVEEKAFIKIAKRIPLHQWNDADKDLIGNFKLLTGMMVTNSQGGEKVL